MTFLNHLRRNVSLLRRSAWEFVYPPTCVLCHCVIQHVDDVIHPATTDHQISHDQRLEFCSECRMAMMQPIVARCRRCDAPVGAYLGTSEKCVHCRDDRFAFSRVVSVGVYTGRLRYACLQCKNPEGRSLAMNLAELLWEMRSDDLRREPFDAIIPVPVHWWQRVVHSEGAQGSIAEVLSRRLNVLCDRHAVVKVRRTPQQASLVPSKRRVNLRDVFRLRGGSIWRGRRILLVDDVLTTGTTVQRIARLFRDAGAEEIVIAVIARGLGDRFQFPSQNVTLSKKF